MRVRERKRKRGSLEGRATKKGGDKKEGWQERERGIQWETVKGGEMRK